MVASKGRTRTVERDAVQQAVLDASADNKIATLVVATNTRFSNPTRDWIAQRGLGPDRPRVVLWDRDALERMVVKHPCVVARVAPGALLDAGMLASVVARFWDYTRLPSRTELERLWSARHSLPFEWRGIVALSAGEMANGEPQSSVVATSP